MQQLMLLTFLTLCSNCRAPQQSTQLQNYLVTNYKMTKDFIRYMLKISLYSDQDSYYIPVDLASIQSDRSHTIIIVLDNHIRHYCGKRILQGFNCCCSHSYFGSFVLVRMSSRVIRNYHRHSFGFRILHFNQMCHYHSCISHSQFINRYTDVNHNYIHCSDNNLMS